MKPLAGFYERYGITMMPLSEALGPLTPFITGKDIDKNTAGKLLPKLEKNPQVAVSLCHNDVVGSNLAVGREGVYFLDWGFAIMSLCGRDFVRIGHRYLDDWTILEHIRGQIARLHQNRFTLEDMLAVQEAWSACIKHHKNGRMDMSAFPVKVA